MRGEQYSQQGPPKICTRPQEGSCNVAVWHEHLQCDRRKQADRTALGCVHMTARLHIQLRLPDSGARTLPSATAKLCFAFTYRLGRRRAAARQSICMSSSSAYCGVNIKQRSPPQVYAAHKVRHARASTFDRRSWPYLGLTCQVDPTHWKGIARSPCKYGVRDMENSSSMCRCQTLEHMTVSTNTYSGIQRQEQGSV